jgi:hypothetical protein
VSATRTRSQYSSSGVKVVGRDDAPDMVSADRRISLAWAADARTASPPTIVRAASTIAELTAAGVQAAEKVELDDSIDGPLMQLRVLELQVSDLDAALDHFGHRAPLDAEVLHRRLPCRASHWARPRLLHHSRCYESEHQRPEAYSVDDEEHHSVRREVAKK